MCKFYALAATLTLFTLVGCAQSQKQAKPAADTEPKREAKFDEEAARLGFPAVFVSQEKPQLDWSKAQTEVINGKPTQVIKGPVVEVCGGCDK